MSSIGIYDVIVLALIGGAAFFGWRKGLATQVASILSIGVSYFVATNFREEFSGMINAVPPWDTIGAMLVLYLGTSFVIWLLFRQIRASIEKMKLREFDRQMGFVFGALKGLALAGIVTMFAFAFLGNQQRQAILESRSGFWIAKFMVTANSVMPSEVQQFVAQYLEPLEQGFDLDRVFPESGAPQLGGYPIAEDPRNPYPTGSPYTQPGTNYSDGYFPQPTQPTQPYNGSTYGTGANYGSTPQYNPPQYTPPNAASRDDRPGANRR